jgi:hypothetical protein
MRTFFTLLLLMAAASIFAQRSTDTVSVGAAYANQIWYSLENEEQATAPQAGWDLAFEITGFSAAILVNTAKGDQVWLYPKGDTAAWATVDTSGIKTWKAIYNSDSTWARGALNQGADPENELDLGWGNYNFITHQVNGDSLFVVKLASGSYQKLWIQRLASGTYYFRHAALDGSMDMSRTLAKSDFAGKRFGYYNLTTHSSSNPEPASSDWELLFTKYTSFIQGLPYTVTGVLQNAGIKAAQAYPVGDPSTYVDYSSLSFSTEINTIGYDWKSFAFATNSWQIADSLVYFVKEADGDIWKLVFTGFGGSASGNFIFEKEKLFTTSLSPEAAPFFSLYPNPASGRSLQLMADFPASGGAVELRVLDLSGREVAAMQFPAQESLASYPLELPALPAGLYAVRISQGGRAFSAKLILR